MPRSRRFAVLPALLALPLLLVSCGGTGGFGGGAPGVPAEPGYDLEDDLKALLFLQNDGEYAFLDLSRTLTPIDPAPEDVLRWAAEASPEDPRLFALPPRSTLPLIRRYDRLQGRTQQRIALRIASACGPEEAVPPLGNVLETGQAWERIAAAYALGSIGGAEAMERVEARIAVEQDGDVEIALYRAIGRGGTREEVVYLRGQARMTESAAIRATIEEETARLEARLDETPRTRIDRLVRERDLDALNHLGPADAPRLARLATRRGGEVLIRVIALYRAFLVGTERVRLDLAELAFDEGEDPLLRMAAIGGIARVRLDGMKSRLETIVGRELLVPTRVAALRALAVLGDRGSQPVVLRALDDNDREVRREAARTLGYLSIHPNESYFRIVVDSGNFFLRDGAALYRRYELAAANEVLLDLERLVVDVFVPIVPRAGAVLLLGMSREPHVIPILSALIESTQGEDVLLRQVAARAAGYHGDPELRASLETVVANPDAYPFDLVATSRQVLAEF